MEVEKIDRKGRKLGLKSSELYEFLSKGRICVDGVVMKESNDEIEINIEDKIGGEFRTVIFLKEKKGIEEFRKLVGNRKVMIKAKVVDCKICVGVLYGYGTYEFNENLNTEYPGFDIKFEAEKIGENTKIADQFTDKLWVE